MKRILAIALLSVFLFSSCHFFHGKRIDGNGNVTTESRQVSGFNSVEVSGAITVNITQAPDFAVKVEIDENLQEYIEVYKEGSVLRIRQQENTSLNTTKDKIYVYVSAPEYRKLHASGACSLISENQLMGNYTMDIDLSGASNAKLNIDASKVEARLSGAGSIELDGEVNELDIHGSGSSDIRCYEMVAQHVDVDISGAGSAEVYAGVSLKADLSGAASVRYKGNPTEVKKSVSGAGSVNKAD
jgi:hypothetical protein